MNPLLNAATLLNKLHAENDKLAYAKAKLEKAQKAFNQQEKEFFAFIESKAPEKFITELGGKDAAEKLLIATGSDTEVLDYIEV